MSVDDDARSPAPVTPSARLSPFARVLIIAAPLIVFALVALILAVAGPAGTIDLHVTPAGLALWSGAGVSALLAVFGWWIPARRARQQRALAEARAQTIDNERAAHRRFLSRLDHELKNPVTAIRSALAVDGAAPAENVRIAAAQANRLGVLVGQLRGLASLETRVLEMAPVDLTALAEEEIAAVRSEAHARGVFREIVTDFPTVPWPLPAVAGDADLLAVVVRNIVLNAVKYSGEGARIEVRGSEDNGFVVLDIADTGWGIRVEDVPFVWDELWRAGDARGIEGTGLGLSLVRVVVQRHGGDVALRSQVGRGTSVRVRVPIARTQS